MSSGNGLFVKQVLEQQRLEPYIPFWELFQARFSGVEQERPDLCVSLSVANELRRALDNSGVITEAMFAHAVLSLPIHKYAITSDEKLWEPKDESYLKFRSTCLNIKFVEVGDSGFVNKQREIYQWMIEQCEWERSVSLSSEDKRKLH
ncbi:hypothetical protein ACODM8_15875 [Vibrio ostreicida]|uniref:hypothetical protein n=1 Tax=Vibrio ostreicida TaxID=526588 RepID=UPI003B5A4802